jgi:SAM-dependent methyltransferase
MSDALQVQSAATPDYEMAHGSTLSKQVLNSGEGYSRWAATYDSFPNPLLALEERCLTPMLPLIKDKLVLDLGCGTGRWLQKLFTLGARTGIGIDISAAMLQRAVMKAEIAEHLVRADCSRLPLIPSHFDFAICSFALGYLEDLRAFTREAAFSLKPGADVIVSDIHPHAYAQGWRTGFRDRRTRIEIQNKEYSIADVLDSFGSSGLACYCLTSEWLAVAEKPLFVRAGKEHVFEAACSVPAIFIARFRKQC